MMTTKTNTISETPFVTYLNQHGEETWAATLTALLRFVHDVDKSATQNWFAFYPLSLFHAFQQAADPEKLARELLLQGHFQLKDQIDSSHKFLYGHRYWPEVKKAIEAFVANFNAADNASLSDQILKVAREVAQTSKVDESLVVGITAAGFMTVEQSGVVNFQNAKGAILLDRKHAKKSPEQVLRERAVDDSQGLLGFLKTVDKKWTITYDENDDSAKYKMNHEQDMAWGAADDRTRNWREIDPRRAPKVRFRLNVVRHRAAPAGSEFWVAWKNFPTSPRAREKRSRSLATSIRRNRSRLFASLARPGHWALSQ